MCSLCSSPTVDLRCVAKSFDLNDRFCGEVMQAATMYARPSLKCGKDFLSSCLFRHFRLKERLLPMCNPYAGGTLFNNRKRVD